MTQPTEKRFVMEPRLDSEVVVINDALDLKVDLTDSRLTDTRTPTDNSVTSAKILNGTIVDEDISASAAIAVSKLAPISLDNLSDVVISGAADKQTLQYELATTTWKNAVASGGVTVNSVAPSTPIAGDAWFDSNDGTLYVYYTDTDTSQWVQVQANSALEGTILARLGALESTQTYQLGSATVKVASQAERDILYPSPVQGNNVFRSDKGYIETYFSLYNASTNVGGATPAGWYPTAGALPIFQVVKNATTFTPPSATWFLLSNTAHWTAVEADPTGLITYNGNFTVGLAGWYEIFGAIWTDGGSGAAGIMQAKKNNTNLGVGDMLAVQSWQGGFNWTTGHISRAVKLNAGDYVHWQYITNNPVAVGTNNRDATYLGVRWLRPAKG